MSLRKRRSSLSLMASGVANITLMPRVKKVKYISTVAALRGDQKAIIGDAKAVYGKQIRDLECA